MSLRLGAGSAVEVDAAASGPHAAALLGAGAAVAAGAEGACAAGEDADEAIDQDEFFAYRARPPRGAPLAFRAARRCSVARCGAGAQGA